MNEAEVVEEYDEEGDLVCVLCEDAQENLWVFTKGIYQKRKYDPLLILATGKWQTLNNLKEIRRSNNAN